MSLDGFNELSSSINIINGGANRMTLGNGYNPNAGPQLTETGVQYFLRETLKNYNTERINANNININLVLFIIFLFIIGTILIYKHKTKPTFEDKKKLEHLKKSYVLGKIRSLNIRKQKEYDQMVTNLPKFESDYEIMHKKFYDV
tara:strand:- start:1822 stop:2256 length:435 start_codon:yes stop_codon:yes gene_type:complete